jgi:hypothetical protein
MALIMFGCALAAPLMRRLVQSSGTRLQDKQA